MKIALVSPYDFAYPGGVVNHISALEHHFTRMGHQVKIIAPAARAITDFGDRFIGIGKPRPIPANGSICRVTISPWLGHTVKDVLESEQFDIIHLHEPLMPMLCTTVLRLSRTVNVGTFHACRPAPGYDFFAYNFGKPISTIFLKKWYHNLDGKIAVSKAARDFVSKYFPDNYKIIPNGVEVELFSSGVSPLNEFCDGKLNILFVGRLEKRKGANYLIDAYKQVKKEMPNTRLIIVGPGTRLRKKYEKWVEREEIKDIVFTGRVSLKDLPRYYTTADVFCSPATGRESFGIVLLEAMASGRPILASNIEGYASILTDGVEGRLVPPRDARALAGALRDLLMDGALRKEMGERGRQKARQYDWANIAGEVLDYYNQALAGANGIKVKQLSGLVK